MEEEFKGFCLVYVMIVKKYLIGFERKSDIRDKITKLSAEYWNYKGFYNFSSDYKGLKIISLLNRLTNCFLFQNMNPRDKNLNL